MIRFFDIAFRPTQQLHEIPADSPDTLKASHTQDRQISNISKQNIDNKDNEETAVDSEQNAGVQPSHNFNEERMSWGKETLTQLKVVFERECSTSPTILPTAATNTTKPFWVPSEKTRCLGPLDSHFPTANTYSPPMSLADTPSPSPSSQSTAHFEASQSEGESDFDAASAPICTPASVLSTSRPQPPGPSISTTSIAATPMPNSLFPGDDEALCKEKLFQEVTSWNYAPNEGTIKSHLIFQSENSERPFRIPSSEVLELELRRLEQMSARRMTIDVHPFRVYGTPELYEHDRLKCWVYLNQHLHGQLWPERYLAKTTKEELLETTENGFDDDEISVWSAATA